jgi:hypothetical protein
MTEHLPECWAKHESDPPAWCICDELRSCENRVRSEAYWNYPSMNGERPPIFKDLGNPFDVARVAYEKGQRDALVAAVQRVEALPWDYTHSRGELITRARTIAAIKGDQP